MTVLLRIVGELGHRHLAAFPSSVEGMFQEPSAGESRVRSDSDARDDHGISGVESHPAMVARGPLWTAPLRNAVADQLGTAGRSGFCRYLAGGEDRPGQRREQFRELLGTVLSELLQGSSAIRSVSSLELLPGVTACARQPLSVVHPAACPKPVGGM